MSRFWSPIVHTLTPYVPGEQPRLANLVKLNTNENPYGPSPKALAAMRAAADDTLRLYPDPTALALRQTIARRHGLDASQVFVGNGSDEVLAHVFMALLKHGRPLYFPDISYSFYPVYCGLYEIAHRAVPLDDTLGIRLADYLGVERPGAVIFPNPNAPTGRLLPLADIKALLDGLPDAVIVVDEAYIDFGGSDIPTAAPLIAEYPNLLVVQTLSKSRSLAGLRVGFALGHPDLIQALTRVKDSFNSYPLDRLALAGAQAAVEDTAWFNQTRLAVMKTRDALSASLKALEFEVVPSAANFVFARHRDHDGAALATALRERSIIVRHFSRPERIAPYLRITIGTDDECASLVAALSDILAT